MKIKASKSLYDLIVMLLYFVLGTLFLLKYSVWEEVPSISLALFSVVVIIYGLFRGYRGYKAYKNENEEQNDVS
jgi:hypothetical protein